MPTCLFWNNPEEIHFLFQHFTYLKAHLNILHTQFPVALTSSSAVGGPCQPCQVPGVLLAIARNHLLAAGPAGSTMRLPHLGLHALCSGPFLFLLLGWARVGWPIDRNSNPIPPDEPEVTSLPPGTGNSSLRGTPLPKCGPDSPVPVIHWESTHCPICTVATCRTHGTRCPSSWLTSSPNHTLSVDLASEWKMVIFLERSVNNYKGALKHSSYPLTQ